MISIILLVRHPAQAHNEHQVQPEEDKPESNAQLGALINLLEINLSKFPSRSCPPSSLLNPFLSNNLMEGTLSAEGKAVPRKQRGESEPDYKGKAMKIVDDLIAA